MPIMSSMDANKQKVVGKRDAYEKPEKTWL